MSITTCVPQCAALVFAWLVKRHGWSAGGGARLRRSHPARGVRACFNCARDNRCQCRGVDDAPVCRRLRHAGRGTPACGVRRCAAAVCHALLRGGAQARSLLADEAMRRGLVETSAVLQASPPPPRGVADAAVYHVAPSIEAPHAHAAADSVGEGAALAQTSPTSAPASEVPSQRTTSARSENSVATELDLPKSARSAQHLRGPPSGDTTQRQKKPAHVRAASAGVGVLGSPSTSAAAARARAARRRERRRAKTMHGASATASADTPGALRNSGGAGGQVDGCDDAESAGVSDAAVLNGGPGDASSHQQPNEANEMSAMCEERGSSSEPIADQLLRASAQGHASTVAALIRDGADAHVRAISNAVARFPHLGYVWRAVVDRRKRCTCGCERGRPPPGRSHTSGCGRKPRVPCGTSIPWQPHQGRRSQVALTHNPILAVFVSPRVRQE